MTAPDFAPCYGTDTATSPRSPRHPADVPVYVRYELCRRRSTSLRVSIAGLVADSKYFCVANLMQGSSVLLNEMRSAVLCADQRVASVEYPVVLSGDVPQHFLCLRVFDEHRNLLAIAKRNIFVSSEVNVGEKRARPSSEIETPKTVKKPANRQEDVIKCIGDTPVTERTILERCGDNRYTREILRRLIALESVERIGKGGSHDPYRYRVLCSPEEALKQGKVDPAVRIRMQRIERKILAALGQDGTFVTEKHIRAIAGDNTGTGRALRHLVKTSRVERAGKGGVADPFTYRAIRPETNGQDLSDCSTVASSKSSVAGDDDLPSDAEVDVAHTLALLATAGQELAAQECKEPVSDECKVASLLDSYIAAAAALESGA
jgi:hypothetical protein